MIRPGDRGRCCFCRGVPSIILLSPLYGHGVLCPKIEAISTPSDLSHRDTSVSSHHNIQPDLEILWPVAACSYGLCARRAHGRPLGLLFFQGEVRKAELAYEGAAVASLSATKWSPSGYYRHGLVVWLTHL